METINQLRNISSWSEPYRSWFYICIYI